MRTSIITLSLLAAIALFGCPGAITPPIDGGAEQVPDTGAIDAPIQTTCGDDKNGVRSYCSPGYICCTQEDRYICKPGSLWQCRKIAWMPNGGIDCRKDRGKTCSSFNCDGTSADYSKCMVVSCPDGTKVGRCIKPACLSPYDCAKPTRCLHGICHQ